MRVTIDLEKLKEIMNNKLQAVKDVNGNPIIIGIENVINEIECEQSIKEFYEQ